MLSEPDAYQDLERIQDLSREQAKLREVVEAARRWRDAQEAAREASEMAHTESDQADGRDGGGGAGDATRCSRGGIRRAARTAPDR